MKNSKIAIIIIVALLCVVCLLIGALVSKPSYDNNNSKPTTTTTATSTTTQNNNASTEENLELLGETVYNAVDAKIGALEQEWNTLKSSISDYNDYVNKLDEIKSFYEKIISVTDELTVELYKYALQYGDTIMESKDSLLEKYEYFDELFDNVYEDASDEIFDRIYDNLLEDIYDAFYEGIIEDAYNNIPYDEYYDALSDEYDRFLDARSDVYDMYLDTRSDIYDFYLDIRSELFAKDEDGARKELEAFRKDIEKLK